MGTAGLWIGFNACVLAILALDLGIFHRRAHAISLREAAAWSAFWVILSLGFNFWILRAQGATPALEFFTGYLIEKSLSMDNVFVFLLLFRTLGIPARFQHRVLFWGVCGALVLRGAMIGIGAELVQRYVWILPLFGAFLVASGCMLVRAGDHDFDPARSPWLRWTRRIFPMAQGETGHRFLVIENGRVAVTPLLLALVLIEGADLLFALDSIPVVFGITRDPFLVYTSNVCAILGLRALYFLLAGALPYFRYLDVGISVVLVSLAIVAAILVMAVVASVLAKRESGSDDG